MSHSRRDFLVRSTCAALGAAAFQSTIKQFGLANLLAVGRREAPAVAQLLRAATRRSSASS